MPLIRITHEQGIKQVFIASESISDLATVEISTAGLRYVQQARDSNPERAVGIARGSAASGQLVYVITEGIVSGVICTGTVNAGDRLMIASGGRVKSLNSITTSGLISGITGINHGILSGYSGGIISGYASINAFTTARVIGKALTSAATGSGLVMFVGMGG